MEHGSQFPTFDANLFFRQFPASLSYVSPDFTFNRRSIRFHACRWQITVKSNFFFFFEKNKQNLSHNGIFFCTTNDYPMS